MGAAENSPRVRHMVWSFVEWTSARHAVEILRWIRWARIGSMHHAVQTCDSPTYRDLTSVAFLCILSTPKICLHTDDFTARHSSNRDNKSNQFLPSTTEGTACRLPDKNSYSRKLAICVHDTIDDLRYHGHSLADGLFVS